ncbi:sugar ABC transporter permease [Asanoa ishikariensis]|uniref:Carbohydrate ABC transporter membrane protein 2, CUT1 family n=1 Tax=Asanoa ishikariensis TaxID=137265 RepID=A0A1H3TKB7_9ACTN|nr:carbohydrate ABC transporter permease [Asanoa ishikariensis]GIF62321.1 sugar ABC transporter permease [Asanoa ishikariensis]SDZ50298.1 carbohydrate ABC transporter membrane protein 2, CUT1 family [Asanoa ishikariensis]
MANTTLDAGVTMERINQREKLFNRICAGVLIAFALLWLIPLLWAVDTAIKPNAETTRTTWLIDNPTLDAFTRTLRDTDMWSWYGASFIISSLAALGTVLVASMAAFALSRMRFRYKNVVFWAILAGIMIPGQVLIVPWFREFDALRLLNTYWAVILPQLPAAIAVFIFKQFFDGLPRDLEEAARMDGASFFRVYRRIVLPLARPAVAAVAIFTFVTTWNDLLWPLLVLSNPDLMTVPVGLATVQGAFGIRYADTMASAILGAIPLVAVFLLFQRQIVQGIAGSGLKG